MEATTTLAASLLLLTATRMFSKNKTLLSLCRAHNGQLHRLLPAPCSVMLQPSHQLGMSMACCHKAGRGRIPECSKQGSRGTHCSQAQPEQSCLAAHKSDGGVEGMSYT
jgi:hypothetical protein